MRIGLIDVDNKRINYPKIFPNLVLMKLSNYYKKRGDTVEFVNYFNSYDKVYKSKVFTFSQEDNTVINTQEIIEGGSGYNLKDTLPKEIEEIYPDYSLYPNFKDTSLGFLTRGCPRSCKFCIVTKKEGGVSKRVNSIHSFYTDQKNILLLDSNLLACKDNIEILKELAEIKDRPCFDFNQGLDIRLVNEEIMYYLNKIRKTYLRFSWDTPEIEDLFLNGLDTVIRYNKYKGLMINIYILVNFNTSFEYDLYRVEKLKEYGKYIYPYVMLYRGDKKIEKKYIELRRYSNNKWIYRNTKRFQDYYKGSNKEFYLKEDQLNII